MVCLSVQPKNFGFCIDDIGETLKILSWKVSQSETKMDKKMETLESGKEVECFSGGRNHETYGLGQVVQVKQQ